jgi:hypothetical protein
LKIEFRISFKIECSDLAQLPPTRSQNTDGRNQCLQIKTTLQIALEQGGRLQPLVMALAAPTCLITCLQHRHESFIRLMPTPFSLFRHGRSPTVISSSLHPNGLRTSRGLAELGYGLVLYFCYLAIIHSSPAFWNTAEKCHAQRFVMCFSHFTY